MIRSLVCAAVLAAASFASAQTPAVTPIVESTAAAPLKATLPPAKAVLKSPATFRAGRPVSFDAAGTVGTKFIWRISPSDQMLLVGDGRLQAASWTDDLRPFVVEFIALQEREATVDGKKQLVVESFDSIVVIVAPDQPGPAPSPTPPGPTPTPGPVVVVPPVNPTPGPIVPTPGPIVPTPPNPPANGYRVLVVYDDDKLTEPVSSLLNGIQVPNGDTYKYLRSRNAKLTVVDDSYTDADGTKHDALDQYASAITQIPILLIINPAGEVINRCSFNDATKPADILAFLKQNGV